MDGARCSFPFLLSFIAINLYQYVGLEEILTELRCCDRWIGCRDDTGGAAGMMGYSLMWVEGIADTEERLGWVGEYVSLTCGMNGICF